MKSFSFTMLASAALAIFASSCGGDNEAGTDSLLVKGSASSSASSKWSIRAGEDAVTYGSPTSVRMTFYSMYVSPNADCSSPIQVADFGEGTEFELFDNPTLVEANVADGTYRCIIMEASDILTFKPDQAAADAVPGICDTNTDYTFDAYRTGEPETDQWLDVDGQVVVSHGTVGAPVADRFTVFASTDPTAATAAGVPIYSGQAFELLGELVVPGQTTFFVDPSDRVSAPDIGGGPKCWLEGFQVGFR